MGLVILSLFSLGVHVSSCGWLCTDPKQRLLEELNKGTMTLFDGIWHPEVGRCCHDLPVHSLAMVPQTTG